MKSSNNLSIKFANLFKIRNFLLENNNKIKYK